MIDIQVNIPKNLLANIDNLNLAVDNYIFNLTLSIFNVLKSELKPIKFEVPKATDTGISLVRVSGEDIVKTMYWSKVDDFIYKIQFKREKIENFTIAEIVAMNEYGFFMFKIKTSAPIRKILQKYSTAFGFKLESNA